MHIPRFVVSIFSIGMMVPGANMGFAQDYPNKPIHIVAGDAGGGSDVTARLIAQGISGPLGQQVIVDNRGGAGGTIAIETVAKAPPDGYTVLYYGSSIWLLPFMRDNVPWDPVKDFSPITLTIRTPNILVVNPSLPVRSVKDLIALAKANPGGINYASVGSASSARLAAELFKAMAGVDIVHIPYKGSAPALNDLIGGQVQLMFATAVSVVQHVKSGRLTALAVTSAEPSALASGLPTVAASGLPGYESIANFGIFAPSKTPAAIVNRLNREIVGVLNKAEVKNKLFNAGSEVIGSSPDEVTATMKSEMAGIGKVIKNAGIRAE